ncbi:PP2C family protein-serine/threonine phosphatase [Yoonia maricola]|uniref:PP2C family protein-serine/threonine phosphatase n=1 Tax=Yoonia maricola TaxID=420999 RepID=UPI001FE7FAC1|nr:protein phosphatase 2C domain-containing protein [Yoonia maricola]
MTDVGCVREINEDSILTTPESGVWLVADGMGGHAAGDFASQTIAAEIDTIGIPGDAVDLRARFMDRLTRANTQILNHAATLDDGTIGSTVAALLTSQGHYACIWSGDSRVYRLRGAVLTQITEDHTEVRALLDAGAITQAEADVWPRKNVITHAIGVSPVPECGMLEGSLADKDVFLICSDGLTEYYHNDELERVMNAAGNDLEGLCAELVETVRTRGGKDNVSVVTVLCRQVPLAGFEADGMFPEFGGAL